MIPKRRLQRTHFGGWGGFWIVLLLSYLIGCAHQSLETVVPALLDDEDMLFEQAEQRLAQDDLNPALTSYTLYLSHYPQGRHADNALRRLGDIYQQQKDYGAAQAFYQKMINQFPRSPHLAEARLALVDVLIHTRRESEAMQLCMQMLAGQVTDKIRYELWRRLSRLNHDAGKPVEAALFAYRVLASAPESEKEQWFHQFGEIIDRLEASEIESLWDAITDDLPRGYLMYRHAKLKAEAGHYGDALELLTAFQSRYPDHPQLQESTALAQTLTERLRFEPFTIGCLLPLSGPYQSYGQRALNGIEMAISQLQSMDTPPAIKLIIKDSGSTDEQTVRAVQALAEARVGAIIGPIASAEAGAREAQKLNIPMVTFTQKPEITAIGEYIFRHFITPQNQVETLVAYLCGELGLRDFAIMYPQEPYGRTFMELFWNEVVKYGGQLTAMESYDPNQTDFAEAIKKLVGTHYPVPVPFKTQPVVKRVEKPDTGSGSHVTGRVQEVLPLPIIRGSGVNPLSADQAWIEGAQSERTPPTKGSAATIAFDALFIPDTPQKAELIMPQLAYYDVRDVYLVGTNLWHSEQLITMTGDYAHNAVMVDGFFKESRSPAARRFAQAYHAIYGEDPGLIEAFAFDTANFLFALLSRPDLQLRHYLRDAIKLQMISDGATGPTYFNERNEAIKTLSLLRIQDGRFVEVDHP